MKHPDEKTLQWTVDIEHTDGVWYAVLYRWTCNCVGVGEMRMALTGLWAGPSMWFKPTEQRVTIMRQRLLELGAAMDILQNAENQRLENLKRLAR